MAQQKLRAAVIGCGLGANHAYAYANAPEYDLVAVCDVNPAIFEKFYERSRLTRGSVKEYTDYNAMIAEQKPDVVSVATPDDYHTNPVVDASNAGVCGIFCEKPICTSLSDADRMIATVEKNGTKMSVDHTRSWWPSFQAVRRATRAGENGGVTRVHAREYGHRAMLFRNATHVVDAISYFADSDPIWLIAAHEKGFESYGVEYKGQGGKDPALDPGTTIIIEYANGVRGILDCAKLTPAVCEFDVVGPTGRFYLDQKMGAAWKTETFEGEPSPVDPPWTLHRPDFFGDILVYAVREMADMIRNDAPSSSPPRRALSTLEILSGALISQSRDSAKVYLPLPRG